MLGNSQARSLYCVHCVGNKVNVRIVLMDVADFYQAVVRPVLEYASPAWHTSLTKQQTKSLQDIQRRALRLFLVTCHMKTRAVR